jgi:predicted TIM-barrel fold metal-dependent hydrolase
VSGRLATELHDQLGHPVIDIDGHNIEYFPALADYLRDEGVDLASPQMSRLLPGSFGPYREWHQLSPAERASFRVARPPWWGSPARNTRDLATALFPALLYERLDEFGIDVSVIYPSVGLIYLHLDDEAERRGACRALNRHNAEAFAPFADRLVPVAAIPMHTPDEAIAGLEHAVHELGFKAVLLAGYVQRPAPAVADPRSELDRWALWLDMYGIDSTYDYDPVWSKCRELGVSVAFHSGSIGWGSRQSISNYMFNHIGHLAEGQHALCKSLFMGGVTRRFPELNFAFLEGGVAWAASLYADLIGHWEKRNVGAMGALDPANIDYELFSQLLGRYAGAWREARLDRSTSRSKEDPATLDEWGPCGIKQPEDIRDLFVPRFFFGCEADDPLNSAAFNTKVNPMGARLQAMFGSDIAHWDVPDMAAVLGEAWETVEHQLLTEADFREFVFTNPVRFYTRANPGFFHGTVVEADVDRLVATV